NASEIQFIANGKVIAKGETNGEAFTLDLDSVENAKDLLYVRVEIKGEGGICLSQALVIDSGKAPQKFDEEAVKGTLLHRIYMIIKSSKLWTIVSELIKMIK
ncbi:MAG: hypothetical protein K6F09_01685, partial [Clostridiales bacterium]|nr:hypothetical protein [Clostridiales bacterium]